MTTERIIQHCTTKLRQSWGLQPCLWFSNFPCKQSWPVETTWTLYFHLTSHSLEGWNSVKPILNQDHPICTRSSSHLTQTMMACFCVHLCHNITYKMSAMCTHVHTETRQHIPTSSAMRSNVSWQSLPSHRHFITFKITMNANPNKVAWTSKGACVRASVSFG